MKALSKQENMALILRKGFRFWLICIVSELKPNCCGWLCNSLELTAHSFHKEEAYL